MISAELEAPRQGDGEAFTDAVTYAWGDLDARSFGLARLGRVPAAGRETSLAIVFEKTQTIAAAAGEEARVASRTVTPLQEWVLSLEADGVSAELTFTAQGPGAEFLAGSEVASAGGIEGYEHACAVTGTVRTPGGEHQIDGRGQRGHSWGEVDWSRMDAARSVSAWLEDGRSLLLSAVRPEGASGHDEDAVTAYFVDPEAEAEPEPLDEARLSTAFDGSGRQRRAGVELYETEDTEIPRRGAGVLLCGTTLDLGELRLDTAFFGWGISGGQGVGRYDLLRRR
jgi:hypothetical protein